jgi:hypothetical protein
MSIPGQGQIPTFVEMFWTPVQQELTASAARRDIFWQHRQIAETSLMRGKQLIHC